LIARDDEADTSVAVASLDGERAERLLGDLAAAPARAPFDVALDRSSFRPAR
jgi:hypothetical protein